MRIHFSLATATLTACLMLPSLNLSALELPLQCIVAPERLEPCPNLIYTSVKSETTSTLVCFCKSDKKSIQSLLLDTDSAASRVALRKLLSQHKINAAQLATLGNN